MFNVNASLSVWSITNYFSDLVSFPHLEQCQLSSWTLPVAWLLLLGLAHTIFNTLNAVQLFTILCLGKRIKASLSWSRCNGYRFLMLNKIILAYYFRNLLRHTLVNKYISIMNTLLILQHLNMSRQPVSKKRHYGYS